MKPFLLLGGVITLSAGIGVALITIGIIPDPFPNDHVTVMRWPAILLDIGLGIRLFSKAKVLKEESEVK